MIFLVIIIALIIGFIIIWKVTDDNSKTEHPSSAQSTTSVTYPPPMQGNRLRFLTNVSTEQTFASARIENGIVYCCGLSEFKVGSYETNDDGSIIVWNDNHLLRIGNIYPDKMEIYLTIFDSYIHIKELNPYTHMPSPLIYRAARCKNGSIFDSDTNQLVATYQGNAIAAAAAFVCLTYEVLTENKYSKFFNWNH